MVAMLDGKRCGETLVLEPSLRTVPYAAGSGKRSFYTASDASPPGEAFVRLVCGLLLCLYGIICPGPLCRRHKRCEMSQIGCRPERPPPASRYRQFSLYICGIICPGPSCRRHKRCDMSLGLEPSLRSGSLHAYGIMYAGKPYGNPWA